MSITAVVWAQDDAPYLDDDPIAVSVLMAYARSTDDGRATKCTCHPEHPSRTGDPGE